MCPSCQHSFDHCDLDLPNAREVKLGVRGGAGVLESDSIRAIRSDLAREPLDGFCKLGTCDRARG
jgi:hypothetical protein